jgi:hypothetical protein
VLLIADRTTDTIVPSAVERIPVEESMSGTETAAIYTLK